jgi:phosphate transport system substrate-binding protein
MNLIHKITKIATALAGLFLTTTMDAAPLKINGSTTVNLPVAEAAEVLRAEQKMEIQVDTQGGSSGGISLLGEGQVQLGMSSKPVSAEDRKKFPKCDFKEIRIGEDAVALVVSPDVWAGGVKSLSAEQAKGLYEGKIKNWKEVGGPDQRVVFFNKEPGRGTWEVFANWLYGSAKAASAVSWPEVGGNEEARQKVATTKGAVTQLSAMWADSKRVFPLAIKTADGREIAPVAEHIATQAYPMSRALYVLSHGEPQGDAKVMVDFLLSDKGQVLVQKHGFLRLADLNPATASTR